MKTVGTKLDNSEYEIFEYCCQENGSNKSEQLRDLIKGFVNAEKESKELEIKVEDVEPKPTIEFIPELRNVRIED